MKINKSIFLLLFIVSFTACKSAKYRKSVRKVDIKQITIKNTQFIKDNKPYYFVGTNYWYGPLIAAKNIGDRERLTKELDLMKEVGIDNLRILVGAEGDGGDSRVHPALQPEQGIYNEDLLDGLDFLMAEMRKRKMYAVLYLNNNWIWSGGMSDT